MSNTRFIKMSRLHDMAGPQWDNICWRNNRYVPPAARSGVWFLMRGPGESSRKSLRGTSLRVELATVSAHGTPFLAQQRLLARLFSATAIADGSLIK